MAGKITKEELHPLLSQKIDDFAAHEADKVQHIPYAVATGAANAYAVTLNPAPTSYVDGMAISVKINVTNTGSSTLNINGLGAKNILKADLNLITSGKLNIMPKDRFSSYRVKGVNTEQQEQGKYWLGIR